MPLTETAIRNAKPALKPVKLFDGGGMFLLLNPNGSRWWRIKYRVAGRKKMISLGTYPEIYLKRARERREEARRLLAEGRDPSVHRVTEKTAQQFTFQVIANEWMAKQEKKLAPVTYNKARWMLSEFVFPHLGARPISDITAPDLFGVPRKIEARGINETARRTKQRSSQIFRYAIATGRAERDPAADLRGALGPGSFL